MPHATQMSVADTGLLVIDVQEKRVRLIFDAADINAVCFIPITFCLPWTEPPSSRR